ncbi:DUF7312 domain-containing protein [Natronomonas marina]|jgi:hypothetical protein|uniref:DUF7312 domain-containing protein n=1 Tax=Natronomonas marina TaxID=2961939 RepID=UPI0020CA03BF|nr:hypothetical protein [Natronomonas marina]
MADHDAGEGATEEEWRFPLSDFEEDGEGDEVVDSTTGDAAGGDAPRENTKIEPGEPTLEGAVFVLLGVGFALFVLSRLFVA